MLRAGAEPVYPRLFESLPTLRPPRLHPLPVSAVRSPDCGATGLSVPFLDLVSHLLYLVIRDVCVSGLSTGPQKHPGSPAGGCSLTGSLFVRARPLSPHVARALFFKFHLFQLICHPDPLAPPPLPRPRAAAPRPPPGARPLLAPPAARLAAAVAAARPSLRPHLPRAR